MKSIVNSLLAGIVFTVGLAQVATAHHSMAGFDRTKSVTVEGTVKQFKWANPHAWIEIETMKDGKPVIWNFEMTAPSFLVRAGWKRTSLNPGDKVAITGRPQISGEPGALFVSVKLADGTVLTERPPAPVDAAANTGAPKQ
jgi:Family of unknown function (DUF6152)